MMASAISYRARGRPAPDPEPEPFHEYSSTQVQITGRPAEILKKMAADIKPADIGAEGIEHESHVTAKFGLHFQTPSKRLREVLKDFGPVSLTFGKTSLFSNEDADVLKVDIDSPDLHKLNRLISRVIPTHDTHPRYIPHCTVAYLKPGHGKRYVGDTRLAGQKITVDSLTFSGRKGHRETLPLGHPAPASYRVR